MSGPAPERSGLREILSPPIRTVDRRPERPRGPLLLLPRTARRVMDVVGGLALAVVLVIVVQVAGAQAMDDDGFAVLLTALIVAAAGGLAVAGGQRVAAVTGHVQAAQPLVALGIGATAGWGLLFTIGFIGGFDSGAEELAGFLAAAAGSLTVLWVVGTIGVLQLGTPTISTGLRRFRRIAVGVLVVAGTSVIAASWIGFLFVGAGMGSRGAEALLIVLAMVGGWGMLLGFGLCGSATAVGRRMERRRSRSSETVDPDSRLRYACPGCGAVAERRRGPHRCDDCGLRVRVRVEEPRCTCGYVLFRLTGDRCPECGTTVPDADRYSVQRFDAADPPVHTGPDESTSCVCGYDLFGLDGDRCPECGVEVVGISARPVAAQSSSDADADAAVAETESSTSEDPPSS